MSIRTLEQRRIAHIQAFISSQCNDKTSDSMRQFANSMPALVLSNGLAQAMAHYRIRLVRNPDTQVLQALQHMQSWLLNESARAPGVGEKKVVPVGETLKPFFDCMGRVTASEYRAMTAEAMAWLQWFKRLCLAFAEPKPAKVAALDAAKDAGKEAAKDGQTS